MARTLIGIPSAHADDRFLASLPSLFSHTKAEVQWVRNKPIAEAYNELAAIALDEGYDYLVSLEDDHWGHTPAMWNALFAEEHPLVSIPYYSRHYPYMKTCYLRDGEIEGQPRYIEANHRSGVHEVDIIGFGMTKFSTGLFNLFPRPWFKGMPYAAKEVNQPFLAEIRKFDIRPKVCFDYLLNHGDLTPENIREVRLGEGSYTRAIKRYMQSRQKAKIRRHHRKLATQVVTA